MSKEGIKEFSNVLFVMQNTRYKLLKNNKDKIDIRLAQMLEEMKELIKNEFIKLTTK